MISQQSLDLARDIYLHTKAYSFDEQIAKAASKIDKVLAEREAQAVQREREAAKRLVDGINYAISMLDELEMFGGTPSDYNKIKTRLKQDAATYNDNRKG
jgi:predicted  nucleic acid-binding Zn-ribbon protein